MYKLLKPIFPDTISHCFLRLSDNVFIPFDPANTDYVQFKKNILEGAELLDADGNPMTAEQAKEYVKELP
jgi:hypothetical protein